MSIPDEAVRVMSSGLTMEQEVALYDAVGRFAAAGRTSVDRQKAVVEISRVIKAALDAKERISLERAAIACVKREDAAWENASEHEDDYEEALAWEARAMEAAECKVAIRALMPPLPAKEGT